MAMFRISSRTTATGLFPTIPPLDTTKPQDAVPGLHATPPEQAWCPRYHTVGKVVKASISQVMSQPGNGIFRELSALRPSPGPGEDAAREPADPQHEPEVIPPARVRKRVDPDIVREQADEDVMGAMNPCQSPFQKPGA